MADSTLGALTAATAATGGLFYGTQSGADRKFTSTAAGAALLEAANAAAQRTLLSVLPLSGGTLTGALTLPNTIFTGLSLTGSQATNTIDVSTTWNTTGSPTLIYGRATNTASGASSNLLDLGTVAGGSLFKVDKTGALTASGVTAGSSTFTNDVLGTVFYCRQSNQSVCGMNNTDGTGPIIHANQNGKIGFFSGTQYGGSLDAFFTRSAAATIQLGTNHATTATAQTLKAHNVTTGTGANLQLCGGTGSVASGGVVIGTNGTSSVLIRHGTATLASGTVTVSDTNIVAGSRIFVTRQTDGGVIGDSYSITRSAGTSFTITSKTANVTVTGDTSTVSYLIINP